MISAIRGVDLADIPPAILLIQELPVENREVLGASLPVIMNFFAGFPVSLSPFSGDNRPDTPENSQMSSNPDHPAFHSSAVILFKSLTIRSCKRKPSFFPAAYNSLVLPKIFKPLR